MELAKLTVKQIKAIATEKKIPGRGKVTRKADIIALVESWVAQEDKAKEEVSRTIAEIPDAWHEGCRSTAEHALMMAIAYSNYLSWQALAQELKCPDILVKKAGDFAIATGADAIKLAAMGDCPLTIKGNKESLSSGFPFSAIEAYKKRLRLIVR